MALPDLTEDTGAGQSRPSGTSPVTLVDNANAPKPLVDRRLERLQSFTITQIFICNTTSAPASYRLFFDADGVTYDETTALLWDIDVPAGKADLIETEIALNSENASIGVRSSVADALTFTAFGRKVR